MDIVTGWNRESPLDFRANPQIRGGARRRREHVTASNRGATEPGNTMAMRRRRIPAQCAVIIALISGGSSVVSAAQSPVMTWPRMQNGAYSANVSSKPAPASNTIATPAAWQKSAADVPVAVEHNGQGRSAASQHGAMLTALIRPAPLGDITPDPPPEIPAPTVKPLEPPVAAPPPRVQQPLSPPTQQGPPPQQQGPAPQPQGPAPQEPAPPPPQPPPPPQRPPGGHVQLAP